VSYDVLLGEVERWIAAFDGDWVVDTPLLRRLTEVDFAVLSYAGPLGAIADPDSALKLVPPQDFSSEARATRAEYIWLGIKLRANRLMHALCGNGTSGNVFVCVLLLTLLGCEAGLNCPAVGGRGSQFRTYCRENPRYHRFIYHMPRNKNKKQQQPPQPNARPNSGQQAKARQKQARNVATVAKPNMQIQRRKVRNTLSISGAMSGSPIGNAGVSLWRASLLNPFNTPGAQCTGDFFVRGSVPYTVKKNFQLSTAGVNNGSIVVFPNLTTMV